jgi:hypothetical protein
MRFQRDVAIHRPVGEVFGYVSDPGNDPAWVPVSHRHARTSPGPMGTGATTEEDVGFLRWRLTRFTWEVVEYDPPRVIAYRSTSGPVPLHIRMRLEPAPGGTMLALTAQIELKRPVRPAAPLLRFAAGLQLRWQLRALKRLLERCGRSGPPG